MNGIAGPRQVIAYLGNLGSSLPTAVAQHRGNFFWKRAAGSEDELYAGVRDSSGVNQLRRILTKTYADTLYEPSGAADLAVYDDTVLVDADVDSIDFLAPLTVAESPDGYITVDLDVGTGAGQVAAGNHTHPGGGSTVEVQEGGAVVDAAAGVLDFDTSDFNVSSSPAGEANISLNYGTGAGQPAEGDHTHAGASLTVKSNGSVADASVTTLDFGEGIQAIESPEDEINVSIEWGVGNIQVPRGDHTHDAAYAPIGSKYIVQTADGTLTNEQALGALSTGIVKNTTTTGVLSIAAAGTDYAAATSGTSILKGNGSGGFSNAAAGTDYAAATSGSAILKGNGSGGFSNAVAGTDYALSVDNLSDAAVSSLATGQVLASANGTSFANLTVINATLGPFFTFNQAGSASVQFGLIEPTASGTQVITIADYYAGLAGRVVGMYLNSNADWTAGTATGRVYIDGAVQTFASGACVLSTTNRRRHSAFTSFANGLAFTAGQRIGMGCTTASWTPTTADFHGLLVVAYTPF
jgi:hypothetical protein